MKTRYVVCGRRKHADRALVWSALRALILHPLDSVIIHGNARPPKGEGESYDRLAGEWGREQGAEVIEVNADWNTHGKAAGPMRNRQMLDDYDPHVLIAFPGGDGTANMTKQARARAGLIVIKVVGEADTWTGNT